MSNNHSILSRNDFHVQQTDEFTCFWFITTHPKHRSGVLEWVLLARYHLHTCICRGVPSDPSRSSAWPWELFPKQIIPTLMWLSSPAHQLLPALHHPSYLPVPLEGSSSCDSLSRWRWKDLIWGRSCVGGWSKQGLWYKPGKEREPPWSCWGGGSSQGEPCSLCQFSQHWFVPL